eukprot:TRINITY_DN29_c0_g1_i1.p1 TRINITY_DN29_c0_g1~~TRINITY_DN29_c0_g1_i1.p1  ORF type:complete len:453 (-),score=79.42 TRINITY_DN29_c0_g1_i1:70-1428(-)
MMVTKGLLCFLLIAFVNCQTDKISSLPLFNGKLGNQYSGYITVNTTAGRNFHYWFVESAGSSPSTDPLVLWLNGGPGCSSLDGYFYENGPIRFARGQNLQLENNPYSWNKLANVLYLESPAGVGFSYSSSPNDYNNQNDERTANDNYNFLKLWLAKHPQYSTNPFYIAGESYAGIYIPSLAQKVLQGILDKSFVIPFKGVLVGNGVTNGAGVTDLNSYLSFLWGHGVISTNLFNKINAACSANPNSQDCQNLSNDAYNNMNDIDMYNIYGDCYNQRPLLDTVNNDNIFVQRLHAQARQGGVPPCTDATFGTQYLNLVEVKSAIHVNPSITWSICNFDVNGNYDRTPNSMVPIYKNLLKNNIRVLIYSGDTDFAVPYTDSEFWTSNDMGLTPINEWRQWFVNDINGQQVAGFVTEYPNGFQFATVKGAGHMVPQYRPLPAFQMFERFLSNQPL